ncbi:MAG: DUF3467 domain-containing protein [Chloroflexota bacterium]
MATKKLNKKDLPESVAIRLVWGDSANIPTIYANNLYITHAGSEFFLVFGEMSPIMELDIEKMPEELIIKPVAKIVIAPENMVKFADVISGNVAKYSEKIEKSKDEPK